MLLEDIKRDDKPKKPQQRNLVAKHSYQKGGAHKDKKNDYQRKMKHKKQLFSE